MNRMYKLCGGLLAALCLITAAGCKEEPGQESGKTVRYDYDLSDYVTLGTYKGVEVQASNPSVSDEEVQQYVMLARSNYSTAVPKDGAAELTDQVNIDYVGYMNGETFDGGSAKDYDLTLGSGSFIDGFEDGLVGAKPGDTVTLNIAFPDPYPNSPDLAGKPVTFEVTVNHIFAQQLPEYTDAFVKEYYGYEITSAFEAALRSSLEEQKTSVYEYTVLNSVWSEVLSEVEVLEYPTAEYNEIYTKYVESYTYRAREAEKDFSVYVADELGMTVSEFYAALEAEVNSVLREEMVLLQISRLENITVTETEYNDALKEYVEMYGVSDAEELLIHMSEDEIRQQALFEKVFDFLVENAVVVNE